MAIIISLVIIFSVYEVTSYVHPYGAKAYYPRGPRPREISYVVDPNRLQQAYASPYPYPVQEASANYPPYQNQIEQPNYQIYQQVVEPNPANYPIYQQVPKPNPSNYAIYQHVEPAAYPVYQPADAIAEVPAVTPPVAIQPTLKNDKPSGVDSNVLNNLAIALQLLIINNLINNPVSNSPEAIKNAIEGAKLINKPYEADIEYPLLNAKFLGSSNFDDVSSMAAYNYGSPVTSPRVGALLKSPYDYLSSPSSDYSTKSNLQNPYAAIFSPDNIKELFTMSDYY